MFINVTLDKKGNNVYNWVGWSITSYVDVLTMQNICDGNVSLGEVIKENVRSAIVMAAATTYREENLEEPVIIFMVFKYDQGNNRTVWEDEEGHQIDVG